MAGHPSQGSDRSNATFFVPLVFVPLFLVLGGTLVCAWIATPRGEAASLQPSEVWVDPARLCWEQEPSLIDPRWEELLGEVCASHDPFSSHDAEALERLRNDLAGLPFVAAIARIEVAERSGMIIELEFRRPVACLPVGNDFQTVDARGVLLPGLWPAPVRIRGAPLPVIGPMSDGQGIFRSARAGDWLSEEDHLHALDVVLSLQEHLGLEEQRSLGRVVVDATEARSAAPDSLGVRLLLEGRRLVLFGRPPALGEPGELPAEKKWAEVVRALRLLQEGRPETDWDLVDVRWDRPEIALRAPLLASADPGDIRADVPRRPTPRRESRRADEGPRVR